MNDSFKSRLEKADQERRELMLSRLPQLMLERERMDDVHRLLTDLTFVQAKLEAGLRNELADHYSKALDLLSGVESSPFGERALNSTSAEHAEATRSVLDGDTEGQLLQRTARITLGLRMLPDDERHLGFQAPMTDWESVLADDVFGGDVGAADALASARHAEELAQSESTGPADNRRSRLEALSAFVAAEGKFLTDHPCETIPAAYNFSQDGPLMKLVGGFAEDLQRPWLRREPRPPAPRSRPLLVHRLEGHRDAISALGLSGDGRTLVSADCGGRIYVWDLQTGSPQPAIRKEPGEISGIAMNADASRLVSYCRASRGKQFPGFRIWDLTEAKSPSIRAADDMPTILGIGLSADGNVVVTLHGDESLRVWNSRDGTIVRAFRDPGFRVIGPVRVSPDGRLAACIANDGTSSQPDYALAVVWDVTTGKPLRVLEGHRGYLTDLQFAGNGRLLVTSSADNAMCVWDIRAGTNLRRLRGYVDDTGDLVLTSMSGKRVDRVRAIACSADGRAVFSICESSKIARLYDVKAGDCVRHILGHQSSPGAIAVSADARIGTTADDTRIFIWNLATGVPPSDYGHHKRISTLAANRTGTLLYTRVSDGDVELWDAAVGAYSETLQCGSKIGCVDANSNGTMVVTADPHEVTIWRLDRDEPINLELQPEATPRRLTVAPNGRIALCCGQDQTPGTGYNEEAPFRLHIIDLVAAGHNRAIPLAFGGFSGVSELLITPDNRTSIVVAKAKQQADVVLFVDLISGSLVRKLEPSSEVTALALSPDGCSLAMCLADLSVQVWDTKSGQPRHIFWKHAGLVQDARFSPDGRLLISAANDGRVCVWCLREGRLQSEWRDLKQKVVGLEMTPDGRHVLAAGENGELCAWDFESVSCVARYHAHAQLTERVDAYRSFTRIGTSWRFALGDENGIVHFVDLVCTQRDLPFVTSVSGAYSCPQCAHESVLTSACQEVVDAMERLPKSDSLPECLPTGAWSHEKLIQTCRDCQLQVRLTPFSFQQPSTEYVDDYSTDSLNYTATKTGYAVAPRTEPERRTTLSLQDCSVTVETEDGTVTISGDAITQRASWTTFGSPSGVLDVRRGFPPCISCGSTCTDAGIVTEQGWVCRSCVVRAIRNYRLALPDFSSALRPHAPIPCKLLALWELEELPKVVTCSDEGCGELIAHLWYDESPRHPLNQTVRQAALAACISFGHTILNDLLEREQLAWGRSDLFGINVVIAAMTIDSSSVDVLTRLETASRRPNEEVRCWVVALVTKHLENLPGAWISRILRSMASDESDRVRYAVREAFEVWQKGTARARTATPQKPVVLPPDADDLAQLPWSACVAFAGRCARSLEEFFLGHEHRHSEFMGWIHRAVVTISELAAGRGERQKDEILESEISDLLDAMKSRERDAEISGDENQVGKTAGSVAAVTGILEALRAAATETANDAAVHAAAAATSVVECAFRTCQSETEKTVDSLWDDYHKLNKASLEEGWGDDKSVARTFFGETELPPSGEANGDSLCEP